MGSIKLKVKSHVSKDGTSLIYAQYCFKGDTKLFPTGEKIDPKHWDANNQKVRKSNDDYKEINDNIKLVKSKIEHIVRDANYLSITATSSYVTSKLKSGDNKAKRVESQNIDFHKAYELFIESSINTKKAQSIKNYITVMNHLTNFEKEKKVHLSFETMDNNFFNKFINYLMNEITNQTDGSLGLTNNSVEKNLKYLRAILNYATDEGYNKNMTFKKHKVKEQEVDTIFLNEEELKKIADMKFAENNQRFEKVRDLFLIGCYTALRYGDLANLTSENFVDGKIKTRLQKTDRLVLIPIHPIVKQILEKYKVNDKIVPPPAIANQTMNEYLKEIGKLAEIDSPCIRTYYKGVNRIEKTQPKYMLISTHTARRSFATNNYLKGVPSFIIMRVTGHKTESSFLKYIRIDGEMAAEEIEKYWS